MRGLEVIEAAKAFGAPVLRGVSFTLAPGGLMAILGASGSGKSTLLRLIAGFERPDAGRILLEGEILAGPGQFLRPERRGIGYVAQDGALFPHLSVADNISFGLPRAARRGRQRVAQMLALVDLPASYADRAPQQLSGGEQQRVALARALAPGPKLILLDEPFSALDAGLRAETRAAVAGAIAAAGASAILVTHDQAEALSMGAAVGVLQNGILAQLSAPEALYRNPASPALASFVGEAVFCAGQAAAGQVSCPLGRLSARGAASGPVTVMIRPEQIKIGGEAPGSVPADIIGTVFYGHDAVVKLRVQNTEVTARVFSHAVPAAGSRVWLTVEGDVVAYPAG
jgi:iron(III) transport system ATP-binding protein